MEKYEDMLYLNRPVSTKHAPMARENRAAQFSPFAALTGYDACIREEGRLTMAFRELDEESQRQLDERLTWLEEHKESRPEVTVTYFLPDERKMGGSYEVVRGAYKMVIPGTRELLLADGTKLPLDMIMEINVV